MRNPPISRTSASFLQAATVLVAGCVLALLLVEPRFEGRNAGATLVETYFTDPFLAYAYVGSVPFFLALCHAFALFGGRFASSKDSARALRSIKRCALALIAFIVGAEVWLFIAMRGSDDIAGGVAMGVFAMLVSIAIVVMAGMLEKKVRTTSGAN
jgi:hypothetical protein